MPVKYNVAGAVVDTVEITVKFGAKGI